MAGAVWLALGTAGASVQRAIGQQASPCLFKRLTHLPCPTCGFTRGMVHILSGRLVGGWLCNPLLFAVLGSFLMWLVVRVVFAREVHINMTAVEQRIAWLLAVGLILANWAYVIAYIG